MLMRPTHSLYPSLIWSIRIGLLEAFAWVGIQFGDYFHQDVARTSRAYPVAIWSGVFGAIALWIALKLIRVEGEKKFDFLPILFWGALLMEALWGCQNLLWPVFKFLIPHFETRFWIWAWFSSSLGAFLIIRTYFAIVRLGFKKVLIRWSEEGSEKKIELTSPPPLWLLIPFGVYEAVFGYITLRAVTPAWSKENPAYGFMIWFGAGFLLSLLAFLAAGRFTRKST